MKQHNGSRGLLELLNGLGYLTRKRCGRNEEEMNSPIHVKSWRTMNVTNIDEMIEKYRPKEIKVYEDNGKKVRVFDKAYCEGWR